MVALVVLFCIRLLHNEKPVFVSRLFIILFWYLSGKQRIAVPWSIVSGKWWSLPKPTADEVNAIVVDIGSCTTKAGYAGEDTPKCVFPSVRSLALSSICSWHQLFPGRVVLTKTFWLQLVFVNGSLLSDSACLSVGRKNTWNIVRTKSWPAKHGCTTGISHGHAGCCKSYATSQCHELPRHWTG